MIKSWILIITIASHGDFSVSQRDVKIEGFPTKEICLDEGRKAWNDLDGMRTRVSFTCVPNYK